EVARRGQVSHGSRANSSLRSRRPGAGTRVVSLATRKWAGQQWAGQQWAGQQWASQVRDDVVADCPSLFRLG
ncbi:MAG TPA: hypothetical protein VNE21_06550, partial [Mycobacteriales bacterium]|nr:hypothetical protein [Mycobacteriales bacterium]